MASTQGSRVKEVRKHFRLSQKELADKINVDQSAISLIENKGTASTDVLYKISQELNVDMSWLISGEGEMIVRVEEKKEAAAPAQEDGWQGLVKQAMQTIADLVATNKELVRTNTLLTDENKLLNHKLTEKQPVEKQLEKQKA